MRRSLTAVLQVALVCGTATIATAQNPFPDYAYLEGHYDGIALQLEIRIGSGFALDPGNSVGFDLYRTTLAITPCAPETRITDQPIPWPSAFPATVTLADAAVTPHTAYRYTIAPVDAQRNPANLIETGGEATTGAALLTHGQIYDAQWLGYYCYLCAQECLGDGRLGLDEAFVSIASARKGRR